MRRVLLLGALVAVGDGALLGVSLALGWTLLTALALAAGVVGTVAVIAAVPPPLAAAAPATVTLGLPLREESADEVDDLAAARALGARETVGQPATAAA